MPEYVDDRPDGVELAFGRVFGRIAGGGDTGAAEFSWSGADEMDEVQDGGWAELRPDGSLRRPPSLAIECALSASKADLARI